MDADEEKRVRHADYMREWSRRNRERVRAWQKRYYQDNKEAIFGRVKKWRDENPEKVREYDRTWYGNHPGTVKAKRVRLRSTSKRYNARKNSDARRVVLLHYGGNPPKCACPGCDIAIYEFLTIDHSSPRDTYPESIRMKTGGLLYGRLIRLGFPSGFRVLCWNCNCAIGRYGSCPHSRTI